MCYTKFCTLNSNNITKHHLPIWCKMLWNFWWQTRLAWEARKRFPTTAGSVRKSNPTHSSVYQTADDQSSSLFSNSRCQRITWTRDRTNDSQIVTFLVKTLIIFSLHCTLRSGVKFSVASRFICLPLSLAEWLKSDFWFRIPPIDFRYPLNSSQLLVLRYIAHVVADELPSLSENVSPAFGPVYTKIQPRRRINAPMTLAIELSLKIESLQNGVATHSGASW